MSDLQRFTDEIARIINQDKAPANEVRRLMLEMDEFFNTINTIEKQLKECKDNELYHCMETIVTIIKDSYSDLMVRSL